MKYVVDGVEKLDREVECGQCGEKIVDEKTGKTKVKKVKVVVVLQHQDSSEVLGKGKFAFRNALGNRVFLTVRSYIDANEVVRQMFGTVCYRVSSSLI